MSNPLKADDVVRVSINHSLDEIAKEPVHMFAAFLVAVMAFHLRPNDFKRSIVHAFEQLLVLVRTKSKERHNLQVCFTGQ